MQDRIGGHPSLRVSTLPVDKPVKDPIMCFAAWCEAVRTWLMPTLSKTGPDGVAVAGSQSQRALLHYDGDVMRNS